MKRRMLFMVTILSAFVLLLAGCATKEKSEQTEVDTAKDTTSAERPLPTPGNPELPGLSEETGGWMPETASLPERNAALQFPPMGQETYHIHTLLSIYIDGKKMPVPNGIGGGQQVGFLSPVHTHDPSGAIHFEAAVDFPFTLGDIFAIWGVVLTEDQVGGYKNAGDKTVQVYVNGKEVADPAKYAVKDKDNIVVGYGKKDSFPKEPPADVLDGPL